MSIPLNIVSAFEEFGHEVLGRRLSIFLDFDGTLAPIAKTPKLAELPPGSREVLSRLSLTFPVAVVTGRGLVDIREKVGLTSVAFAANHGMEIRSSQSGGGGVFEMDYDIGAEKIAELRAASKVLCEVESRYEGSVLEDKGTTLSLHYRQLPSGLVEGFKKELDEMLSPFRGRGLLRVTGGKKVVEVRPHVDWNKGRAVEWMLGREPFTSTFPIYIGDDETDRDGFRAVSGIGASVYVGAEDAEATCHMEQSTVVEFLRWLIELGS